MNVQTNTELGNDTVAQLYNLRDDPGETQNVAAKYPAKVKELETLLEKIKSGHPRCAAARPEKARPENNPRRMTLTAGTRLGSFQIVSLIGAGGMGEVYRARDTQLDRDVALKVLPDALADDSERLHRFEREAKSLAALNHPNIAQVFGIVRG